MICAHCKKEIALHTVYYEHDDDNRVWHTHCFQIVVKTNPQLKRKCLLKARLK